MEHSSSIDVMERAALEAAHRRADDGGVWSHSQDRRYLIFCVGQEEDKIKTFLRYALESGLGFKPLRGCYKGQEERSFIVNAKDLARILPFIAGQETVLLIHDYDRADVPRATLIHLKDGSREPLGYLVQATKKATEHYESWTFDPVSGWYFVAVSRLTTRRR
jgi:hypothetical protein